MNYLFQQAISFFRRYVDNADRVLLSWLALALAMSGVILLGNELFTQYEGNYFFYLSWLTLSPFILLMCGLGMYVTSFAPKLGFIVKTYCFYYLVILIMGIFTTGIQYTPFGIIDGGILKLESALGIDQLALLAWTHAHPMILKVLQTAYDSLGPLAFFLPVIITLLFERRAIRVFLLALIVTFIVGGSFYYFFPTVAPAGMLTSPLFSESQLATSLKFYQIHHYLPVTTADGGIVALPSFHVVWATLFAYLCKSRKWLFYPMLVISSLIIISTVMLGWHYVIDVVAGLGLAWLGISASEYFYDRYRMGEAKNVAATLPTITKPVLADKRKE